MKLSSNYVHGQSANPPHTNPPCRITTAGGIFVLLRRLVLGADIVGGALDAHCVARRLERILKPHGQTAINRPHMCFFKRVRYRLDSHISRNKYAHANTACTHRMSDGHHASASTTDPRRPTLLQRDQSVY